MDVSTDRLNELQDWSREQGHQRFVSCVTCGDSGEICAEQRVGNRVYRVTGGCPKCDRVPRGLSRIDPTDPSLIFSEASGRPEPVWSSPRPPASYYHPEPPEPPEPDMPVEESGQVDIWAPVDMTPEEEAAALRFAERERNGYAED